MGKPGGGGGIPTIPEGKPGGGGGMWSCGATSHNISGRRASSGCDLLVLPGGGPSGIGMSSSVSSSSSSFDMPGGGPSGIGISSSASSTYANQSTEKDTRINGSPPSSSSGLLVGAVFLEVWPSLGCRRERYTSFRCSGCSSKYFSFFLMMLSSSAFNSLSLFWSASESDAVEESFSISSSRSGIRCYNLQVPQCVGHTPCVLFHQ